MLQHGDTAALQCFSTLSKALHALVRGTPELFFHANVARRGHVTYRPALALGSSLHVENNRIASLLASSFDVLAAQLLLVDLRATAITAISVVTVLQTCPLLEELDVGECKGIDVLALAA